MLRWKQLQAQKEEEQKLKRESEIDSYVAERHALDQWLIHMDIYQSLFLRPQPVESPARPSLFDLYSDEDEGGGDVATDVEALEDPFRPLALEVLLKDKECDDVKDTIEVEVEVEVCDDKGSISTTYWDFELSQYITSKPKPRPTMSPKVGNVMSKRSTRTKQFKHTLCRRRRRRRRSKRCTNIK